MGCVIFGLVTAGKRFSWNSAYAFAIIVLGLSNRPRSKTGNLAGDHDMAPGHSTARREQLSLTTIIATSISSINARSLPALV